MRVTKLERFFWWCDRWLWWTVNGWFAMKAAELMNRRTIEIKDPDFITSIRVE